MGALTDHRKRSSAEFRLPLSPLFSSPTKKPRFASPTSPPFAAVMHESLPSKRHTNHISFSRPIHGPQRIIKSFCLGSSPVQSRRPSRVGETPNFFSQQFRRKPDEGLDLHEYRRLVEEHDVSPDVEPVKVKSGWQDSYSPELNEVELFHSLDDPSLRVEDEKSRALASEGAWKERILVKGEPLYKELHAKANERDGKLNDLEFQLKFQHQKFIGLRKEAEVLQKRGEKPKEDLEKLFGPLVAKEEEEISRAFFSGLSNEVLVTHESSNIVITREVLQCLRPGAWLNDEVINLYLELLKEREKREPKIFLKCHFFSTFFYKRLISAKQGYDFKAVKRWTTQRKLGYSLIECDKIFVPIHKEIHWCLAVINIKDKSFQYLDSLGGMDKYALKMLARYLMDESSDKSAKKIDTASWKKESVDELPLQKNGWDCGMFMLKYADFYSRGLKLCFSQDHMSYFRDRTALEIIRLRAE